MKPVVAVNVSVSLLGAALLVWHEPLRWQLGDYRDFLPVVLLAASLFALRGVLLAISAAVGAWDARRAAGPAAAVAQGATLVTCPQCRRPSASVKRYGMLGQLVFLGIFIQARRQDLVACPPCMRALLAEHATSLGLMLGGNVLWPLFVTVPALIQLASTFVPGHSPAVRKALVPAVQPLR